MAMAMLLTLAAAMLIITDSGMATTQLKILGVGEVAIISMAKMDITTQQLLPQQQAM